MDYEAVVETYMLKSGGDYSEERKNKLVKEVVDIMNQLFNEDIETYAYFNESCFYRKHRRISKYLGFVENGIITEGLISSALSVVSNTLGLASASITHPAAAVAFGLLTASLLRNPTISRVVANRIKSIAKGFDAVGRWVSKKSRYVKFRFAIAFDNLEECYTKSGIDPDSMNLFQSLKIGRRSALSGNYTKNEWKKVEKLENCFLDYSIDTISALMKAYFICLRQTGDFEKIARLKDDDLMKIGSGLDLSPACTEYYTTLKTSFDNFYDLLDFLFGEEGKKDREKLEVVQKLRDSLISVKKNVQKHRSDFRQRGRHDN